jgi:hypothetical protein
MNTNQATRAVIEALGAVGMPYMLVGSFSSNVYGVSRATKDADFVVQCRSGEIASLARHLGPPFRLDPQITFETVTGTTRYVVTVEGLAFRVELFRLSDDPHDQERFRRRREVPLPDMERRVFIPTAEDVIITKLRWALHARRGKDRDDVRDVIVVQGDALDWDYIHRWCDQHGTRELLDQIRAEIPPLDEAQETGEA